jgi:hypothetical protein
MCRFFAASLIGMRDLNRISVASGAIALALLGGGLSLAASPMAAAKSSPRTNVSATGGDNTAVDIDGTQGDFNPAVQGTTDSDGDQDAFMTNSEEVKPQEKAPKAAK